MAKEKKIGIKHFLIKELRPTLDAGGERYPVYTRLTFNRKSTRFPNNFTFAVHGLTENDFKAIFERHENYYAEVESYNQNIEKIVRFEYKILNGNFSLSGINNRYLNYFNSLIDFTEKSVAARFKIFISRIPVLSISDDEKESIFNALDDFFVLGFAIAEKIIPNLRTILTPKLKNEITAFLQLEAARLKPIESDYLHNIDWLDKNVRKEYQYYILNPKEENEVFENESQNSPARLVWRQFPANPILVGNYVNSIDRMIAEYIV